MLRLTQRRRTLLSDALKDVANLITAAVVVSAALGDTLLQWPFLAAVVVLWSLVMALAVWIVEDTP